MKLAPLVLLASIATALLTPSAAAASPQFPTPQELEYVNHLARFGIHHRQGPAYVIANGWDICADLRSGFSPGQVAYGLWAVTDLTIDPGDAAFIVGATMEDLCPDTAGRLLA